MPSGGQKGNYRLMLQPVLLIGCPPLGPKHLGFPAHHQLPELAQTHVRRIGDAIQPSHLLPSPSPPAFNLLQLAHA